MSLKEDTATVLDYMVKQNRPYNANDVFLNLKEQVSKANVAKALSDLASKGKLKEKTYNKQKIYFPDQSQFEKLNPMQLSDLDKETQEIKNRIAEMNKEIAKLETELQMLKAEPSTADAKARIEVLEKENAEMKEKLTALRSSKDKVSAKDKKQINADYDAAVQAWRKRKAIVNSVVEAVMEGYPKKKSQLLDDIGIETDEQAKIDIKEF
eukprot:m.140373 g.140373  ORF g.140373 m.140373 type:complete len:210 (+) comp20333_c1_seq4:59-688(+)